MQRARLTSETLRLARTRDSSCTRLALGLCSLLSVDHKRRVRAVGCYAFSTNFSLGGSLTDLTTSDDVGLWGGGALKTGRKRPKPPRTISRLLPQRLIPRLVTNDLRRV